MEATAELTTYNARFEQIVRRMPDRIAVRLKTPAGYRQITYGELHRQVRGVALALLAHGLQRQARAAILSENRPEWVVAYLGIYMAGGSVVPLDPQISPEEWRRLLDDSETQAVFVSGLLLPKLQEALQDSPLRDRIICFDPVGSGESTRCLADMIEAGQGLVPPPALPETRLSDVVVIIYTSGTTGKPKGVMLSQENVVSEITAAFQAIRGIDERDVFLCLLPLQHVFASVVSFLIPLYVGAQVVFADTLKRSEILAALQEAGISVLATVPQFFYLFHGRIEEELAHKGRLGRKLFRGLLRFNRFCINRFQLNLGRLLFGRIHRNFGARLRLFVSGGSAFDPKVAQEFYDLGFTILQGYGLTETTGAAAVTRVERNIVGSVGPALPGTEITILDPGQGGVGEVAIRGPIVMKGYYRNAQGTAGVMRDGWFLSGDLGWMDEQGNLFITGRKKEVIVLPNGKNIYPDEVEAHYAQCPYIKEIAVLGIAEPERSGAERLHAVVVPDFDALKARRIANAREILRDEIARLSHQLPQYKRLMSYQIQKEPLPCTTTHKIKRLELKRMIESGELREDETAAAAEADSTEDRELLESAVGQEVISTLRETYRRDSPVELDMNLELDLGFDSMERVELLASLEQSLGLKLPESFGAEIYTVRDLIRGLQQPTGATAAASALRQSWGRILSPESLGQEESIQSRFSGTALALFRFAGIRMVYLIFKVFFRLEAAGLENLPREGPFLICPNHQSYIDPLIVLAPLPYRLVKQIFFVGAADFFSSPLMKLLARVANIFPVDPDAHLLRAMKIGAYGLRSGRILCIFPEGARSFDGGLGLFKKGAAILAREIGVVMVPVAIRGAHEVWARDSRRIHLHKLKVMFGEPLRACQGEESAPYQADTIQLRQTVARLIELS
ncbi:MAG: AMP-binding protein [Acidobacteriia bacterium]|nr:AMP-binding protein [Terriglobia bacterium]